MTIGAQVAAHLPYLRRYARALCGSQGAGDAYVRATLEAALADADLAASLSGGRVPLYAAFSRLWSGAQVPPVGNGGESELDGTVAASGADPHTTLVVYMGLATLPALTTQLAAGGLPLDTPAVAVERGTTPEQRAVYAPLGRLQAAVAEAALVSPTLIVIGQVVSLAPGWQRCLATGQTLDAPGSSCAAGGSGSEGLLAAASAAAAAGAAGAPPPAQRQQQPLR